MKITIRPVIAKTLIGLMVAVGLSSAFAQAKKEVTFAHQDMVFPYRTVMESGELEKATGYKINWRMFGGGPVTCTLVKWAPAHWQRLPAKVKTSSWSGFWTTSPALTCWWHAMAPA